MVDSLAYVDVNIFVYWLGRHQKLGKTAYNWIKRIEERAWEVSNIFLNSL